MKDVFSKKCKAAGGTPENLTFQVETLGPRSGPSCLRKMGLLGNTSLDDIVVIGTVAKGEHEDGIPVEKEDGIPVAATDKMKFAFQMLDCQGEIIGRVVARPWKCGQKTKFQKLNGVRTTCQKFCPLSLTTDFNTTDYALSHTDLDKMFRKEFSDERFSIATEILVKESSSSRT